jgi:ATP-dependent HslUV protease ATP-binding subunit HslU
MNDLTPRQIVEELDRYVIGQSDAKRAVAVAIRNRWRRRQLHGEMAREVYPKNIIMSGPTGVGKTEIARRLAKLTDAPFVKIEASKFTEVGYHGRDVESMIRDLLDQAMGMVRTEQARLVQAKAHTAATERLIDLLLPGSSPDRPPDRAQGRGPDRTQDRPHDHPHDRPTAAHSTGYVSPEESGERKAQVRDKLREQLEAGKLDEREVELTITTKPHASVMFANMGIDQMDPQMSSVLERMIPEQVNRRRTTVAQARQILIEQETEKLVDEEKVTAEAIERTQDGGIVFLDEIDKIAVAGGASGGTSGGGGGGSPDVSRQGVQRDLLPIVEGTSVTTRHGVVQTDHILFIAAGAFHSTSVSDLMPELQGRFPIRVELSALNEGDFVRILTEPSNALTKQQQALMKVEGIEVSFDDSGIQAVAQIAAKANATLENIGARRLMTIVEKVFEQVNFDAPEMAAGGDTTLSITGQYVRDQVQAIAEDEDLSRFVL